MYRTDKLLIRRFKYAVSDRIFLTIIVPFSAGSLRYLFNPILRILPDNSGCSEIVFRALSISVHLSPIEESKTGRAAAHSVQALTEK
jgi:hypothetical protein